MGLASGSTPLPFGHSVQPAIDIEGLSVNYLDFLFNTSFLTLV